MRIGFDSHAFRPPKAGLWVYAWNLIKCLREIGDESEYRFYACYLRGEDIEVPAHPRNVVLPRLKAPWMAMQKAGMALGWPKLDAWFGGMDILHGLWNYVPPVRSAKRVVTVHDVAFRRHPERFKPEHARHFDKATGFAVRESDVVLAVSENTKRDVVEFYGIDPGKIVVTYPGTDHDLYRPIADAGTLEAARRKHGVRGKTVLYVGTLEPRKNLGILLDAFAILKQRFPGEVRLLLAGKRGHESPEFLKRIDALAADGSVRELGFVSDSEKVLLYNIADLFVFPSVYEGFGSPLAEAMACGCPVIASRISAMPEVVGDAGKLIDPARADELAEAIAGILSDQGLRDALSAKGLERAKRFTYRKTAEETLRVYRALAG